MPCNIKPSATLSIQENGLHNLSVLWFDNKCSNGGTRQVQYKVYHKGVLRATSDFAALSAAMPFGTGTHEAPVVTASDVATYLIGLGFTVNVGDRVSFRAVVLNCEGETDKSNIIRFDVDSISDCTCTFARTYAQGQTGNTAAAPAAHVEVSDSFTFNNGFANPNDDDYTASPLTADSELMWLTLSAGCTSTIIKSAPITGITGNVPLPLNLQNIPSVNLLVFKNGGLQHSKSVSATELLVSSTSSDVWVIAALDSPEGCAFNHVSPTDLQGVSGSTIQLPASYNSTNSDKWILVRDSKVMYPSIETPNSNSGFVVDASGLATLDVAAVNESFMLLGII